MQALTQHLEAEAEGLLGCVMVFSLVTAAKDWLEANNLSAAQDWGVAAQEEAEAAAAEEAAGIRKNRTGRESPICSHSLFSIPQKLRARKLILRSNTTAMRAPRLARDCAQLGDFAGAQVCSKASLVSPQ
jgi:hypothetical protein